VGRTGWLIWQVAERFTDGRVPDPGVRALFARQHRWQCWLDVEAALAAAEAECGIIPAAAAQAIESAARLAALDVARIERGIAETSHPLMALVTELAMAAGEHGERVHWGATTQNITQTGDVLVLREAHRKILRLLAGVLTALTTELAYLPRQLLDRDRRLLDPAIAQVVAVGVG